MSVALSLLAALSAGTSDFLGGLASRRAAPILVTAVSQMIGGLFAVLAALVVGGNPTATDLLWGALGGVGAAIGLLSIYQGYARASVAIVAPIAGVGTAVVPVLFDAVTGAALSTFAGVGIGLGLVAIGLISLQASNTTAPVGVSLAYGLAGAFGLGLLLLCLSQTSDDGGVWPVAPSRAVGALLLTSAIAWRGDERRLPRGAVPAVVAVGVLGTSANALFVAATQIGSVSVAAVVTAMFPAVTVIWARFVFSERLRRQQVVGLGLAMVSVALIAAG